MEPQKEENSTRKRRSKSYYESRKKKRIVEKSRLKRSFGVKTVQVDLRWTAQFEIDSCENLILFKAMRISRDSSRNVGVQTELTFGSSKLVDEAELELDMSFEDLGVVEPMIENGKLKPDPRINGTPDMTIRTDKDKVDVADDFETELNNLVAETK